MLHLLKWLGDEMVSILDFLRETHVIFEFFPEVPDRSGDGPCGSISEWADCISFDFPLDVPKQIDVFFTSVTGFYAMQYFLEPAGSFAAW